jgi:hypothetical protein
LSADTATGDRTLRARRCERGPSGAISWILQIAPRFCGIARAERARDKSDTCHRAAPAHAHAHGAHNGSAPRRCFMARSLLFMLFTLVVSLFSPAHALAQQNFSELRGRVVDTQGGVLPGVTIIARHQERGTFRESVSVDEYPRTVQLNARYAF